MSPKILYTLVVALGFNTASGVAMQDPAAAAAGRQEQLRPVVVTQSHLDPARAYTERRWIGLRRKGVDQCPGVAGWEVTPLEQTLQVAEENEIYNDKYERPNVKPFAAKRAAAGTGLLGRLGLDRFCIYTPQEEGPRVAFLPPSGLKSVQMDRMALSTTSAGGLPSPSDALGQKIWQVLAGHFRDQTGQMAPATSGSQGGLVFTGEPRVRLTFIDSQPDGEEVPSAPSPGSLHGFTLAHLAQDLVCPLPGRCAAKITTRRALGYRDLAENEPLPPPEIASGESGHVGLVSDLAMAIVAEVVRWKQVDPDKKLIINLSLGWDGELFKDLDKRKVSKLEPSVQAVYKAIRFARRSGALVIAAAGNQRGGQPSEWPLLPAAWELRRPTWFPFPLGKKPVYAVAGVDSQGLPLPNSRQGGWPRRAAYSDHSVTARHATGGPTAIYTGTSVSAAVASSIAAVVWHLRPELRPAQVMRLMARSGDELDSQADFYAWKKMWLVSKLLKAPQTRRLSLCPAVARACGKDGSRCPAPVASQQCQPWDRTSPDLWSLLRRDIGELDTLASTFRAEDLTGIVDVASQRWVIPQPEETPCPSCTLVPQPPPGAALMTPTPTEYALMLEISQSWKTIAQDQNLDLVGGTLYIDRFDNGSLVETTPYPLQPTSLTSGSVQRIVGVVTEQSLVDCRAQIIFEVKKADGSLMSILNPVVIDPLQTN